MSATLCSAWKHRYYRLRIFYNVMLMVVTIYVAQPSAMDWAGILMYVHPAVSTHCELTDPGVVARFRVLSSSVHSPPLFHPPSLSFQARMERKATCSRTSIASFPVLPQGLVPIITCHVSCTCTLQYFFKPINISCRSIIIANIVGQLHKINDFHNIT